MDFPACPNYVKRRGCDRSAIGLLGEGEDFWTFRCTTCSLVWVVSKPTAIARGQLRKAEDEIRKHAERIHRREKRTLYFT